MGKKNVADEDVLIPEMFIITSIGYGRQSFM